MWRGNLSAKGSRSLLLIGGATTSKAHTAVRIAPVTFSQPVVHVLDASRAVPVVSHLLRPDQKPAFVEQVRSSNTSGCALNTGAPVRGFSPSRRRARAPPVAVRRHPTARVHRNCTIGTQPPSTLAARTPRARRDRRARSITRAITLADLVPYIDWSPFFHAWELRGIYPAILDHPDTANRRASCSRTASKLNGSFPSD